MKTNASRWLCAFLFAAAVLISGCSSDGNLNKMGPCSASNCLGCCDPSGHCHTPGVGATANQACGENGAACAACSAQESCNALGVCQNIANGCSSANCSGCCASNGTCITPSNAAYACGANGSACQVCSGSQICGTNGTCQNDGTCTGCLDNSGTCQLGTAPAACGTNGATCVACGTGQSCTNGACTGGCAPQCSGKQCGPDGCNGSCGSCGTGQSCNGAGQCVAGCAPQCSGKQCGPDGCTGSCGTCGANQTCDASGQCQTQTTGSVGPGGGTVPSLYFAVLGDTRPGGNNQNQNYPTAIITKLYQDLEALNPKPQFVLTTGDYQFDDPGTGNAAIQIGYYKTASLAWTGGPIFSAMGNHECNGYTASNMDLSTGACDGVTSDNYSVWFSNFVQPLGKTVPYYSIPINATDGSWTSKFIIVACNAWDSTQQSWLQAQLATPTTYTFLIRHEDPTASAGPCVSAMDSMLQTATYNALIVGHVHQFCSGSLSPVTHCTYPANNVKYFVVGNGGASTSNDGYVTVKQNGSTFTVSDYDYSTNAQVATFNFQ